MAERLELIWENALPDLLTEAGLRTLEPTNRLSDDESCQLHAVPEKEDVSALLRALYALRRSVWLSRDDNTMTYMPVSYTHLVRRESATGNRRKSPPAFRRRFCRTRYVPFGAELRHGPGRPPAPELP